jgi:hypothetical protein
MGAGRAMRMTIQTDDPETGQYVYRRCCKNRGLTEVRGVVATYHGAEFSPVGHWPRPPKVEA